MIEPVSTMFQPGRIRRILRTALAAEILFFFSSLSLPLPTPAAAPAAQESLDQYKARFDKESDPVRKAKILVKLADAQFQQARTEIDAGKIDDGYKDLETLRDECLATHQALKAKFADPENKSGGFKELQITARVTLQRLREVMAGLSGDDQRRFGKLRQQFEDLDNDLVHELFPRQPGASNKASPKS
jgi:hypothetical protein